jgi:peptidoglycan/xylan/chitin deacetylase (PgdA/CDA1 family)
MTRAVDRFWALAPADAVRPAQGDPTPGWQVVEVLDADALEPLSGPLRIELPELRHVRGLPVVRGRTTSGNVVTLVGQNDDGAVELAFDPDDAVERLIRRHALTAGRPVAARLPFHYRRVPAPVRRVLRDLLMRRQSSRVEGFPAWPVEPSVEAVRRIYLAARRAADPTLEPKSFWPEGKRWALLLSHDIDSAEGLGLAGEQAEEERERGLAACWFVVGRRYPLDAGAVAELVAAGAELGLHGDTHDNKLAFLPLPEIERRLDACADVVAEHGMRGFRSPSMLRTDALYDALAGRFSYDSSMPDTGLLPAPNGCATVFPFEYRGVLILPLTLPPDGQLLARGLAPEEVLATWIAKAEWVRSVGGMAFHLVHPEQGFSAAPAMREVCRRFLDWVAEQGDALRELPIDLAAGWQARSAVETAA